MQKNLSRGNSAPSPAYGIAEILNEIRQKSLTEREKGSDFERLMRLWFLTDPRYSNLEQVWLFADMYHGVKPEFLKYYLNDFCYNLTAAIFARSCLKDL